MRLSSIHSVPAPPRSASMRGRALRAANAEGFRKTMVTDGTALDRRRPFEGAGVVHGSTSAPTEVNAPNQIGGLGMPKRPTEVTRSHARVLACVPESTRDALANAAHVQRRAEVGHKMSAQSVSIHFQQLVDMGLVELTAGYCRRTLEGDRVVDPVGAIAHATVQS